MSVYSVQRQIGSIHIRCKNGSTAAWSQINNKAACAWNKRVSIASNIWNIDNAPTLRARAAWSVSADVTTNVRPCTAKLRADMPVVLEFSNMYMGETLLTSEANAVLYNATAEPCQITDMYAYQGDPEDDSTKWNLTATGDFWIPAYTAINVRLLGRIHPSYLHGVKISAGDMNLIFVDTKEIKTGTAPKLLAFNMYLVPHGNWDVNNGIYIPRPTPNDDITSVDWYNTHITGLLMANDHLHCENTGTLAPVDQYTGNGVYGFELNAYYTSRVYQFFMPNTVYDQPDDPRGSMWVNLDGLAAHNLLDGKYKYKITMSWMQRTTVNCTISYHFVYFIDDSNTSVIAPSISSQAFTANTNYVVSRTIYLQLNDKPKHGIAILPRLQRTGSNGNYYVYTSQFSCQVTPYPW